jgi:hypothetical protein
MGAWTDEVYSPPLRRHHERVAKARRIRRGPRIWTHRLEHRILRGCDADLILWPDCSGHMTITGDLRPGQLELVPP